MTASTEVTSNQKNFSILMLVIATIALVGACFLTNPPAFSQAHIDDHSMLKSVVSFLGLADASGAKSAYPTLRGLEIRDLCFYLGSAALMLALGAKLVASSARPRMTTDDLFDLKRHFSGPYAYWALFLFVSVVSSYFSHAPDVALGGVLIRLLAFGWWLPLAIALRPADARRLTTAMTIAIALMASVGIWYYFGRPGAEDRLRYPVGNELWYGACLLPAIFIAAGGILAGLQRKKAGDEKSGQRIDLIIMSFIALVLCVFGLYLTRSRSATAGLYAGACFALILLVPRKARALTLLASILIALAGVRFVVLPLLEHSTMGDRAHSVRSRLNHEWPYALTLWFNKPVGGHGEGGYTMLAGQFAREDQLSDPNAIAIDERVWVAEAHNEYLNLLADVGVAGTVGFLGALIVTLFWAIRYVDQRRDDPAQGINRCVVIGLAGAIVAIAFEEGASVGLRHPGLPPLFFTTWACLWAMVREQRPAPVLRGDEKDYEVRRLGSSTVRLAGVVSALAGVGLGFVGIQNWRGTRAQYEAQEAIQQGNFEQAIELADDSGTQLLDPMRKLVSRMFAIEARVYELLRRIQTAMKNQKAPADEDLRFAEQATINAAILSRTAPSFLQLSRLQWQLALARRDAHWMRNEKADAAEYQQAYLEALNQCRSDEPFIIDYLFRLWGEVNEPLPQTRFDWLRLWLRRNQIGEDPRFGMMLQQLATQIPGFGPVLDGAVNVASQDAEKPIESWQDPFSPETLRIAAAVADANGDAKRAVELVDTAAKMYAEAGGRLFYGQSAALLEEVNYLFLADPTADPKPVLEILARASQILNGPMAETGDDALKIPLPREFGQARLAILLASGREDDARKQLEALTTDAMGPIDSRLAVAYARIANQFVGQPKSAPLVAKWASRAEALDSNVLEATFAKLRLSLSRGNDDAALAAAKHIIDAATNKPEVYNALLQAEMEKPESGIWKVLRETYKDFPPSPRTVASQPAEATRRVPDVSELPNEQTTGANEGSNSQSEPRP